MRFDGDLTSMETRHVVSAICLMVMVVVVNVTEAFNCLFVATS